MPKRPSARNAATRTRRRPVEHLYATKFFQRMLLAFGAVSRDLSRRKKPKNGPPPLTTHEHYLHRVFHYSNGLSRALARAEHAVWFLGTFPASRGLRSRDISRNEWLTYHYFVYCVMLASVYECALQLVNAVFSLGLDPRVCRNDTVRENWHLIGTQVPGALKKLDQALSKLRPTRNKLVHHAAAPPLGEVLELYTSMEWSEEMAAELQLEPEEDLPPAFRKPFRDYLRRAETRDLVARLRTELESVVVATAKVVDLLDVPYVAQLAARGLPIDPSPPNSAAAVDGGQQPASTGARRA